MALQNLTEEDVSRKLGAEQVRKCILIADDHDLVRRMICSAFEAQGFEVHNATNGAEAIQKAQEARPDLIILDLAMPVMNGLEAARALKSLMPMVPLVMFTNTIGSIIEEEAQGAGISIIVGKGEFESLDQLLVSANSLLG